MAGDGLPKHRELKQSNSFEQRVAACNLLPQKKVLLDK
jgi:hypothetical protein